MGNQVNPGESNKLTRPSQAHGHVDAHTGRQMRTQGKGSDWAGGAHHQKVPMAAWLRLMLVRLDSPGDEEEVGDGDR